MQVDGNESYRRNLHDVGWECICGYNGGENPENCERCYFISEFRKMKARCDTAAFSANQWQQLAEAKDKLLGEKADEVKALEEFIRDQFKKAWDAIPGPNRFSHHFIDAVVDSGLVPEEGG